MKYNTFFFKLSFVVHRLISTNRSSTSAVYAFCEMAKPVSIIIQDNAALVLSGIY